MSRSRKALLTTVVLAALGGTPALWAVGAASGNPEEGMGMMKGKEGMSSGQMGNMMPMMQMMSQMNAHMKQMNKMMENCNRMTQTMMDKHQTQRPAPENG